MNRRRNSYDNWFKGTEPDQTTPLTKSAILVKLTPRESLICKRVGQARNEASIADGKHGANGFKGGVDDCEMIHVEGVCGEMAFAKAFGIYPSLTINTYKEGFDVGKFQIRCRTEDYYELYIRPNDPDSKRYVLVTRTNGRFHHYQIRGYYWSQDAKAHPEWLKNHGDRPAAHFVPHDQLLPVADLKDEIDRGLARGEYKPWQDFIDMLASLQRK